MSQTGISNFLLMRIAAVRSAPRSAPLAEFAAILVSVLRDGKFGGLHAPD
jgi:hypothetical protein